MTQPNQLPFEGKHAVNFQIEAIQESFFDIKEASKIADQIPLAYPELPKLWADLQKEIDALQTPQPEQPIDYSQPLYVIPGGLEAEAYESAPVELQPGDQLNQADILARIEQIHKDAGGQQIAI